MISEIVKSDEARQKLITGVTLLADATRVTLGPKGRNVIIQPLGGLPYAINDGATIAKHVSPKDSLHKTGVLMLFRAAKETNELVGDGTTTAIIIGEAIVKAGTPSIAAGANAIAFKSGLDKAAKWVDKAIKAKAIAVKSAEEIAKVATISCGGDSEIGAKIAEAISSTGKYGSVSLEDGFSTSVEVEKRNGMVLDRGYLSRHFCTDLSRMEATVNNAYVLLSEDKISLNSDIVPLLEKVATTEQPLLIIANDIGQEPKELLALNKARGAVLSVAVKAPAFGEEQQEILQDLAIFTGSRVASSKAGLKVKELSLSHLGRASATISASCTTISAKLDKGHQSKITARCEQIQNQINASVNSFDRERLQKRLSKLSGGIVAVLVGGITDLEVRDRKLRVEDAIAAAKAAVEEGIVPGGGATLARLSVKLQEWSKNLEREEQPGALALAEAMRAPLRAIAANSRAKPDLIEDRVLHGEPDTAYNALSGEIEKASVSGVIDPVKVPRIALKTAASVAGLILASECIIAEKEE